MGVVPATEPEASKLVVAPEVLAVRAAVGPWSGVMAMSQGSLTVATDGAVVSVVVLMGVTVLLPSLTT